MEQNTNIIPVITKDSSATLFVPELDEHYHSVNGAINESMHIFINYGLQAIENQSIKILEIGFGTGLNALLTWIEARKLNIKVIYHAIEKHPVSPSIASELNYSQLLNIPDNQDFMKLHTTMWNIENEIDENFTLKKILCDLSDYKSEQLFNIIYFDAFGPDKQPEMWEPEIFDKLYKTTHKGGLLITYSAKGSVRRALRDARYTVEKLPGPAGKREITRAWK